MVGNVEKAEPKSAELREDSPFIRDATRQNPVERANAVGGDKEEPITELIDIAHLAARRCLAGNRALKQRDRRPCGHNVTCKSVKRGGVIRGVKERRASLSLGRLLNNPTRITTLLRVFSRLREANLEWSFAGAISCPCLVGDLIFNGLIEQVPSSLDTPLFDAGPRCS